MNKKKYFKKNGIVYGVSYKDSPDFFNTYVISFDNWDQAIEWLHTCEYNFKTRELITKTQAKKILKRYLLGDIIYPYSSTPW